jgi:integrase
MSETANAMPASARSNDDFIQMCKAMAEEGGVRAIRDKALLLFGYAGAFRRSEITQRTRYEDEDAIYLDFDDLQFNRFGVRVTLRKSKTDQEAEGQEIFINYGATIETCPVTALKTWMTLLEERGVESGPVFPSFFRKGDPIRRDANIRNRPLCARSFANRLKYWAAKIGLDPKTIGGHSLRAGHATTASENGASAASILRQGRWKSYDSMEGYIRRSKEHKDNSSSTLGL